jgi:hypothetical protein
MYSYPIIHRYNIRRKEKKQNTKLDIIFEEDRKYNSYNQINLSKKIKQIYNSFLSFIYSKFNKY